MDTNTIITFCLLIGLLFVTLSFVLYQRKALLMLRALFSDRSLQQLLREGKKAYDSLYFASLIISSVVLPCLLTFFFYFYTSLFNRFSPLQIYGMCVVGTLASFFLSRLSLWYFTAIFNFQEEGNLYAIIKTFFRFYNATLLVFLIPLMWYTALPIFVFVLYFPLLVMLFGIFFIRFVTNITGKSRVYFFIYFCSLEILPYLLLAKCIEINI